MSCGLLSCSNKEKNNSPVVTNPTLTGDQVEAWITKGDQSALLRKEITNLVFSSPTNTFSTIDIDSNATLQTIDGFGYTLTGGSAVLINNMGETEKSRLLQELFGKDSNSIGISYLRVSIGASDLSPEVFSYDDMPAGQTDLTLQYFSLSKDTVDVIPILKRILAINPAIKIMGSPWSPPTWMKDNKNSVGGSLLPQYYNVYANFFV